MIPVRAITLPSLVTAGLFQLAWVAPSFAQNAAPKVDEVPELSGLSARWKAALDTLEVPGFAVAIVKDGKVLALDGFGVRDAAGNPATPDTCYYIASATKPYTAMGACVLAGEGKIDLDAPLRSYLPQLELPDPQLTETITMRDLLCHRHGLNSEPIVQRDAYTGQITDEIYFRLLRQAEIAHEVRYSNVHFTLAGRVIEAVSGMKWQVFLDKRLFEPAGMPHTTALASEMFASAEHAEPLLRIDGSWQRARLVKTDRTMHAAGGMGTTARDASRWLILNLNGGEIDGQRILTKAMAREYYTQQSARPKPQGRIRIEEGYAMGWQVGKYRDPSRPYYFHGGGYVGTASYFCFLPNERIGVAVLCNGDGGADLHTIVSIDVLDRLLGVTGERDLLPVYEEESRKRRAEAPAPPSGLNPVRAPGGLSRPAETYAGTFSDPAFGEVEVFLDKQGDLAARFGDIPIALISREADVFTAYIVPRMTTVGRFEIGPGGDVDAVTLEVGATPKRFVRTAPRAPQRAP
jgi:CubicO group peptidase (beta-lactamase class C family)